MVRITTGAIHSGTGGRRPSIDVPGEGGGCGLRVFFVARFAARIFSASGWAARSDQQMPASDGRLLASRTPWGHGTMAAARTPAVAPSSLDPTHEKTRTAVRACHCVAGWERVMGVGRSLQCGMSFDGHLLPGVGRSLQCDLQSPAPTSCTLTTSSSSGRCCRILAPCSKQQVKGRKSPHSGNTKWSTPPCPKIN